MQGRIARMFFMSLRSGDALDYHWFDAALATASSEETSLDRTIWKAVEEILDEVAPAWREREAVRGAALAPPR